MIFCTSPSAKWVLFKPPPLVFSISLLLHSTVSVNTQATTFIWLKPSWCCRALLPSPCTLISRHHQQYFAIAFPHAVMLLLADAPLAIPEIFLVLCSHCNEVTFPCYWHWHLLSSSLPGVSHGFSLSLDKIGPITFTAPVWDKLNISRCSCGWSS